MSVPSLVLEDGRITLPEALAKDEDILAKLTYSLKRYHFYMRLLNDLPAIRDIVARHLGIPSRDLETTSDYTKWRSGSFNVCIPMVISTTHQSRLPAGVLIRFPLPYKLGEEQHPGNVEEKLRSEAGTYIWLKWNCPTVPVPRLLGFGLPGDEAYSPIQLETWSNKALWMIRSAIAWRVGNKLPPFHQHNRSSLRDVGYLVIEFVGGRALYPTWKANMHDLSRRQNLYKSLAKIMLILARRPLPRIGSWTVNSKGVLTLTNRPLTSDIHEAENLGIPVAIDKNTTYSNTDSYYTDLLAGLDSTIRHQPNSIHDRDDGIRQLGAMASLRVMLHHFVDRDLRHGPFVFMLTDLHQSNIFVDEEWNIVNIIDLEWACACPVQMLAPPKWLTDQLLDELAMDKTDKYKALHQEFVTVLHGQEKSLYKGTTIADRLRRNWETGAFWYFRALCTNPNLAYTICTYRLDPMFKSVDPAANKFQDAARARLWDRNTPAFLDHKIQQQKEYYEKVKAAFAEEQMRQNDGKS